MPGVEAWKYDRISEGFDDMDDTLFPRDLPPTEDGGGGGGGMDALSG